MRLGQSVAAWLLLYALPGPLALALPAFLCQQFDHACIMQTRNCSAPGMQAAGWSTSVGGRQDARRERRAGGDAMPARSLPADRIATQHRHVSAAGLRPARPWRLGALGRRPGRLCAPRRRLWSAGWIRRAAWRLWAAGGLRAGPFRGRPRPAAASLPRRRPRQAGRQDGRQEQARSRAGSEQVRLSALGRPKTRRSGLPSRQELSR